MLRKSFGNRSSGWKGILSGLVGGLTATIAMTQFQNAWNKANKASQTLNSHDDKRAEPEKENAQDEDATMKAAGKIACLAGVRLSHEARKKAGPVIHYAFGTAMGAAYGLAREAAPRQLRRSPLLSGVAFGGLLFLAADEFAVPALGLSGKPSQSPASRHLYGLVSHLVYGLTLESMQTIAREVL